MSASTSDEARRARNLGAARALAAAGCAVFPCDPRTGQPHVVEWAACSTTDAAAIEALWQRCPDALAAIDLAKAGLLVFEIRAGEGEASPGLQSFALIAQTYEWDDVAPPAVATADGVHLYFRQPQGEPLASDASLAGYGIAIHGHGGFVIGPGAERGDGAEWVTAGSTDLADALAQRSVPAIPDSFVALVRRARERASGPANGAHRPLADLFDRPAVTHAPLRQTAEPVGRWPRIRAQEGDPELWQNPDLSYLGSGRTAPPAFPLEALGEAMGAWCAAQAQARNAPVDYVAATLLAVTAAMIGNRCWPQASSEWREPPVLWVALVGAPSSGKTPAQEPVLELVRAVEREWETRVLISDATPATIAALLHRNPGGLLLQRTELAGWLRQFDFHSGDGGRREMWLAAYDGRRYAIDRCKDAGSIEIPHLTIGLLGAIAPDNVAALMRRAPGGACARFLWCWPEPAAGCTLTRAPINTALPLTALRRIHGLELAKLPDGRRAPGRMELSDAAAGAFETFVRAMKQRALASFGGMAELAGKAPGHCLRLAVALRFLDWTQRAEDELPGAIEREQVERAARLVESYFLPMAKRTFGEAAIPPHERYAMTLARWLRERRAASFNAREARRQIAGGLRAPAHMERACATLVEAGLLRPRPFAGSRGRRRSDFEVNPAICNQQAGRADSDSACQK